MGALFKNPNVVLRINGENGPGVDDDIYEELSLSVSNNWDESIE